MSRQDDSGALAPLRIAVLVKQVPRFEEMELGPAGRLVREGLELELNPYCRRAVSKGVELARASGGRCTVVTLGPPSAEDCLREAIAWGADDGVLVTDPAFAGSDTLATSRALVAALRRLGDVDLVITGKNSVDADTGQVPAQVAALLDLPLAAGVRELHVDGRTLRVRLEHDDGWVAAELDMPAVLSTAERLTEPAKVDPEGRAGVDPARITRLSAADLGRGPWGQAGSPTVVGRVQRLAVERLRRRLDGDVAAQVREAVAILDERGAFSPLPAESGTVPPPVPGAHSAVLVLVEPEHERTAREMLGAAARLAAGSGLHVTAAATADLDRRRARSWGADRLLHVEGTQDPQDVARALVDATAVEDVWAVLVPSTIWGREVAGRFAALSGSGLVGDAIDLDVEGDRLVAWKPAFGGNLVAAVTSATAVQAVTVRPGVLPVLRPRHLSPADPELSDLHLRPSRLAAHPLRVLEQHREDDVDSLPAAQVVIGVGTGVPPDEYPRLEPLRDVLGADLAATRKVTDKGWMPHARQVGITGHSIAPRLYVALGMSGKFNHLVGVRGAGAILAVNNDPAAPVFDACDAGVVADWHEAVPLLVEALRERRAAVA